jgi:hypothetical protein
MNRYTILSIAGTIGAIYLSIDWYYGTIAGLVVPILLTRSAPTKRVVIEDLTTGKIEIQPNDQATQRYIAGRGE